MKRGKHRNDKNHGRNGWVGGNPRYDRKKANKVNPRKDVSMGKN